MNEIKTLVVLTPGFPKDEADSTCLPERQIFLRSLKINNPLLKIIVLAFQYPFIAETYCWHGIQVISFNGKERGKHNRLMVWLAVWRTLRKVKKQHNIIGVLSFWLGECALLGKYFGKKNKIKQYTWILGQDARKGNKYFGLVNPKAENLIALSDFIADEFYKNYLIMPKYVIPVGIDTSIFFPDKYERTIDVMGAGSLITLKQYNIFINVIKSLTSFYPDIKAVICGKGYEKNNLLQQIEALDLQKNITLMDEIPHNEVLILMQQSKIFLHPSSYEGFGAVCAEALYAGCHVISFCKPMKESIEHWYLAHSQEEMIQKAFHLLENKDTTYKSVLFYSAERVTSAVMNLF